ncbi:MmcQ/YjbR family DNA-binding protein [Carboxylicivirga sp. M1479]|uniref:MmcQ/YjbR family DNA-binding protein n=1 Tax=Carboxylicivirga sp. M1479 TaxID=2594476 RepID=UPI001177BA05|nr:MmcQ/YjbR family DNA-binding protein [Carboxylicivirga sp. M1479]TRX72400.1 MmcQ/YjbR family DNA-binding protein [Carboxylicivirga sp. M1479]
MNIEEYREYCIAKPAVTETFPFDEVTLVFKVANKMFALTGLDKDFSINLKCDPERAIELREEFPAIQPGWHMNKKHWNTVHIDGSLKDDFIKELIDHSYELIVKSLSKKIREENGL